MNLSQNKLVFVTLAVCFLAVGVHLFFWSRRQLRRIRRFAQAGGLRYQMQDTGELEKQINECVSLDEAGKTRAFSRIRDIVALNTGTLFRAVELLDLNPWGEVETSHHARTAVFFPRPCPVSGIFNLSPTFEIRQRYPTDQSDEEQVKALLEASGIHPPPCPLSLTFMRGHVIAYLEPLVVGVLNDDHLRYLSSLAERLATPTA